MNDTVLSIILFSTSTTVFYLVGLYHRYHLKLKPSKTIDKNEIEKIKFISLFNENSMYSNSNIEPELYIYENYKKAQNDIENENEKKWKSRSIVYYIEKFGNIIMNYNFYRSAFAYYCDRTVPYNILNFCAMRYVRIYKCRDWFLDTNEIPHNVKNEFNEMKIKEEMNEKEEKRKKFKNKINIDVKSDVFLKKRKLTHNIESQKDLSHNVILKKEEKQQRFINNFVFLGKINNYSILQDIPKKKHLPLRIDTNINYESNSDIDSNDSNIKSDNESKISDNYQYIEFKKMRDLNNRSFVEKFKDMIY